MPRKILVICGDLSNLGDLALLLQNLELAQEEGRLAKVRRWAVLPPVIERQVTLAGGELVAGRNPIALAKASLGADMVIGGGQLVRGNASLASLFLLVCAGILVRISGGNIWTRGLGIGRVTGVRRFFWRWLFAMTREVVVRDQTSLKHALALAPRDKARLAADMCFLPTRLHDRLCAQQGEKDRIVIAPCKDESEGRSIDPGLLAGLLEAAKQALPGHVIIFNCHDPRPSMDRKASADLIAQLGLHEARIQDSYELDELAAEYRSAALVITNRLHSAIFTMLMGQPLLLIDDGTQKTAMLAEQFAVPLVSADRTTDFDRVVRNALQADFDARTSSLRKAAALARSNLV